MPVGSPGIWHLSSPAWDQAVARMHSFRWDNCSQRDNFHLCQQNSCVSKALRNSSRLLQPLPRGSQDCLTAQGFKPHVLSSNSGTVKHLPSAASTDGSAGHWQVIAPSRWSQRRATLDGLRSVLQTRCKEGNMGVNQRSWNALETCTNVSQRCQAGAGTYNVSEINHITDRDTGWECPGNQNEACKVSN